MLVIPDVDLGLKGPFNPLLTIMENLFMVIGEVDIGLIPANLSPITQAIMVDFCVYLLLLVVFIKVFTTMKEVIVLVMIDLKRPATIHFKIA